MWKLAARLLAVVVSAPLLISVFDLWRRHKQLLLLSWKAPSVMPISTGLLGLGIAIGIIASTFALTSSQDRRRTLWTALTVFSSSLVLFGILLRHAILSGPQTSLFNTVLLAALGALLIAYSAILALRATT